MKDSAPRLLLVEDDPPFARTLRRLLAKRYDVHVSPGFADAAERLAGGERFDAYVLDLHLGDGHAADLYAQLDEEQKKRVLVTGGAFSDEDRAFLKTVRNAPLMKPFERERLHQALASIVSAT